MAKDNEVMTTAPATLAELKKAFPSSDAAFREECQELEATLADAQGLWADRVGKANAALAEKNAAQAKKIDDLETAAKAKEETPGVEALGVGATDGASADTGDPIATWDAAVAEKVKAGMDKPRAIAAVVKEQPELQQSYIEAYGAQHATR